MKRLWTLISIIAVVNLLAVLGFGGWLVSSGRMDKERFRELLAAPEPPPAEGAETPTAEDAASGEITPTSVRIEAGDRQMQRQAMSIRRLAEEKLQLDKVLDSRESKLTSEQESFRAERSAWESSMSEVKAAKTDEQFTKAVKLLESMPAKQAKELVLELVSSGKRDQAVAYIDSMSPFKRSGLLKSFKGDEEMKVATELLEALRQRTPDTKAANATPPATPPVSQPAGKPAGQPTQPARPSAEATGARGGATAKPVEGSAGGKPTGGEAAGNAGGSEGSKPVANTGATLDKPDGKGGGEKGKQPAGSGGGGNAGH